MARLCLALLLVVCSVLAKPTAKKLTSPKSLTVADIQKGCAHVTSNANIESYMISFVYAEVAGFCAKDNTVEQECLVGLVNQFQTSPPASQTAAMDALYSQCSSIGERLDRINATYEEQKSKMSADARSYLDDFTKEVKTINWQSANHDAEAVKYVCILIKFYNRLESDSSLVNEFTAVWPQPMSALANFKKSKGGKMLSGFVAHIDDETCPTTVKGMMSMAKSMSKNMKSDSFVKMY